MRRTRRCRLRRHRPRRHRPVRLTYLRRRRCRCLTSRRTRPAPSNPALPRCGLIPPPLGVLFRTLRHGGDNAGRHTRDDVLGEEMPMDDIERRAFMKGAAIGALTFTVGGAEVLLTPRQAHAQNVPLRTLTAEQGATLDAMGEALVPGAKTAGITNFVDQQISGPPEEALLQARILNVRPPYANFYRAALTAIDTTSDKANGRKFAELNADAQRNFINLMRQK